MMVTNLLFFFCVPVRLRPIAMHNNRIIQHFCTQAFASSLSWSSFLFHDDEWNAILSRNSIELEKNNTIKKNSTKNNQIKRMKTNWFIYRICVMKNVFFVNCWCGDTFSNTYTHVNVLKHMFWICCKQKKIGAVIFSMTESRRCSTRCTECTHIVYLALWRGQKKRWVSIHYRANSVDSLAC